MTINQWIVYARFDPDARRWNATVGDGEVSGSMHDVVLALNAARYRIISVVPSTMDMPGSSEDRRDSYVKAYAIFVNVEA